MSRGRAALVLLALALVASAATAASSPAHGSKGKKGKGSSCPNAAACGLATADRVAALELFNTRTSSRFTSTLAVGSGDCNTVDYAGLPPVDWEVFCDELGAGPPRTATVFVACPDVGEAIGIVSEFTCRGYVTDGTDAFVQALPTFTSGEFGSQTFCQIDTSALADGTLVAVESIVACSGYSVLDGAAKTAAIKLSELMKKP